MPGAGATKCQDPFETRDLKPPDGAKMKIEYDALKPRAILKIPGGSRYPARF